MHRKQRHLAARRGITKASAAGFTLIEVLLVVVIIGILAAIVVPRLGGRTKEAQVAAARATFDGLSLAIDQYEVDNGSYPASLQALLTKGSESNWKGPYLKKGTLPLDPWGKEYVYTPSESSYVIKSLGPDGGESADDVTSN